MWLFLILRTSLVTCLTNMSGDVWYLCRRASTSCRLGSAASAVARARASSQQQASLGFIFTTAHRSLSRSHGGLWKYINVMNGDENIMRQCSVTMAGCATRQMTWSPDHCLWSHTIDTECRDWPRTGHRAQLVLEIDTSLCRYIYFNLTTPLFPTHRAII